MFKWLFFLMIIIPLIELLIIIWASSYTGVQAMIGLIILTGAIGATLARRQGIRTLRQAQISMQNGQIPGDSIIDGICILIGGLSLLMPGFISDIIGFFLLIPFTREIFKNWLKAIFQNMINRGNAIIYRRF